MPGLFPLMDFGFGTGVEESRPLDWDELRDGDACDLGGAELDAVSLVN